MTGANNGIEKVAQNEPASHAERYDDFYPKRSFSTTWQIDY